MDRQQELRSACDRAESRYTRALWARNAGYSAIAGAALGILFSFIGPTGERLGPDVFAVDRALAVVALTGVVLAGSAEMGLAGRRDEFYRAEAVLDTDLGIPTAAERDGGRAF